jgi:hypothetical protein
MWCPEDTMTQYPNILFNKSEQLRRLGAYGGRASGRNHRARRKLVSPPAARGAATSSPARNRRRSHPRAGRTVSMAVGCGKENIRETGTRRPSPPGPFPGSAEALGPEELTAIQPTFAGIFSQLPSAEGSA